MLWFARLLLAGAVHAQRGRGELHLSVVDSTGGGLESAGSLVSQAIQLKQSFATDSQGRYTARSLPFRIYPLGGGRPGFGAFSTLIEVRPEGPRDYKGTLGIAPIESSVVVTEAA